MAHDPISDLCELGLTEMESRIYICLLNDSPATAYRVAQSICKPTANTYSSMASLEEKGFVMYHDADKKLYRAVPRDELLHQLQRHFDKRRDRAEQSLARIEVSSQDNHVYHITTVEGIFERALAMMRRAKSSAILDAFPEPLFIMLPDIEEMAARGVDTTIKTYQSIEIAGTKIVQDFRGSSIMDSFTGQWLNIVIDAREHLIACFSKEGDRVIQSVWSRSPLFSWIYQSGLTAETTLDEIFNMIDAGVSLDKIRDRLATYRMHIELHSQGRPEIDDQKQTKI